jgi:hypothetical protein
MISIHGDPMDWHLDILRDAARMLDSRLVELDRHAGQVPDPNA